MNARKAEPLAWLILLLGAGALARFWDLSWQFSHNDDIGVAKTILDARASGGLRALLTIPRQWTYAPVQFFVTYFLVHPDQGYRELLFWGRLPSCLAAIGGLGAFVVFYRRFREDWFPRILPALALLAFSWQFIIYSKHMSNYAIGVTAGIGVLLLLLGLVQKPSLSWKGALGAGLVLSFFSHISYQILLFVPPFLAALAFHFRERKDRFQTLLKTAAAGVVYGATFAPIFFGFLMKQPKRYGWSGGLHGEFNFHLPEGVSLWQKIFYAGGFFTKNLLLVMQSNHAFLPSEHPLFVPLVYYGLGLLMVFGVWSFIREPLPQKRTIGFFMGAMALFWAVLMTRGAIAFSPTRHMMILIPMGCLLAGEGLAGLTGSVRAAFSRMGPLLEAAAPRIFALGILIIFAVTYPVYLRERRDPFVESEILKTLNDYQAGSVFSVNNSMQILKFQELLKEFRYYDTGTMEYHVLTRGEHPYRIMAWISPRKQWSPPMWIQESPSIMSYISLRNVVRRLQRQEPIPEFPQTDASYRVLYSRDLPSEVEMDYSNRTQNGSNSLHLTILEREDVA